MLTLALKTELAFVAMANLTVLHPEAIIAQHVRRLRLPRHALQKTLTLLKQKDLVLSTRERDGGYMLARPAEQITLADVMSVVEGPFQLARCSVPSTGRDRCQRSQPSCGIEVVCPIIDSAQKVHDLLERCMSQRTVGLLAFDASPAVVVRS